MSKYQVEYSKSSRALCQTCQTKIEKSTIRVGKMVHFANIGEMGRMGLVWNHYTCFWGPQYQSGNGWSDCVNNWANFECIDKLNIEDQKMIHHQIKGLPMDDDAIEEAQKKTEAAEANAVFTDSDPETIIYTMINKNLDVMKVPDIKEVIKTNAIECGKKTKKADLIKVIMDQSINKISNLAYDSLNKHLTANSLKEMLKGKGQSCSGTKKDLILRVLQSSGGVETTESISSATKPVPALSFKEMGPDHDLLDEEWAHLQPFVSVGSREEVKQILEMKSAPRHLKIANNFSIQFEDFNDLMVSFGLELIVIEAGDSDTGCGLDSWAAPIIAEYCPRLQKLSLESCRFSDEDLIRVGYCCPRIRYLRVTGNNKCPGNLKDKFLKNFKEDRSFLKKLRILDFTDQMCDFTQVERMSKARKSVLVRNGDSGDDRWYMPGFGGDSMEMMGGKFHL